MTALASIIGGGVGWYLGSALQEVVAQWQYRYQSALLRSGIFRFGCLCRAGHYVGTYRGFHPLAL